MDRYPYYAVVFAYDADGSLRAEMPCCDYEQVMFCAARYEKVRVVSQDGRAFRLKLTSKERAKYPLPKIEDTPLEWMRDWEKDQNSLKDDSPEHPGPQSDIVYDPWRAVKKDRWW